MSRSAPYASLLVATMLLGGCGGRVFHPAASSLGKSLEAMTPVLDSSLAEYPNEIRSALLENGTPALFATWERNPSELLCRPVRSSVELAAYSGKLHTAADSLISVSGESPTEFSDLAAATVGKYAVSSGETDPAVLAANARERCLNDFKYDEALRQFLGGAREENFVAAAAGLTELWGLVRPIATGVLGFIDQQRRARAIVAFLRTDGDKLKGYVDGLEKFSEHKSNYERASAARAFKAALAPAQSGSLTDEQKQTVLEAAATYDALAAVDPTSSYRAISKSLDRLIKVGKGKYSGEDLSAAISGLGDSLSSLKQIQENIVALEKDGDKHAELKAAIDKIRGKKAEKPSSKEGPD